MVTKQMRAHLHLKTSLILTKNHMVTKLNKKRQKTDAKSYSSKKSYSIKTLQ